MENKFIKIPFELEFAKAISNGKAEGNIVTCNGRKARVVCWNYKSLSGTYPILALVENGIFEEPTLYTVDGRFKSWRSKGKLQKEDLMLEVPEYKMFRDGDIIGFGDNSVGIFKSYELGMKTFYSYATICDKELVFYEPGWNLRNAHLATEEECKRMIDALKASDHPRSNEYLERFFPNVSNTSNTGKEYEFKPFDKVLVKDDDENSEWSCNLFSRKNQDGTYRCIGGYWDMCIPYEGNEHLLGTSDNP